MKTEIKENSHITLDDLAIMVKKGFDEQDKKFEAFKSEMYDFKSEMYDFKSEILGFKATTEASFLSITSDIRELKTRVSSIEFILSDKIQPTIETLTLLYKGHERRISTLERKAGLARHR